MNLKEFLINLEVLLTIEAKSGLVKKIISVNDSTGEDYEDFIVVLSDGSAFNITVKET